MQLIIKLIIAGSWHLCRYNSC